MPQKIGRFEIQSEIARSAGVCVYKAADPENGQTVALKAISLESLGDRAASLIERLLEEAESTKVLSSHNIALLYGAGDIDGHFCAATEYVQGNSIAAMLARKDGFSIWDLQDIARQSSQALDHAHSKKVVHQSLEPGKIMVSWDGTVKILGFGISAMGASAAQATGNAPEALRYMSPEQLRGEPLDARSNLFSLGAILYEMVTDKKAFGGDDAEQVRQQILNAMPVPPAMIIPKIPGALSEIIMKALSKARDQRYSSGQELVAELEHCKEAPKATGAKAAEVRGKSAEAPAPRASAAAAGLGSPSASPSLGGDSRRGLATMSAAAAPAPPELDLDSPLAAQPGPAAAAEPKRKSFSDVAELPPLKEVYVKPEEPAEVAPPEPVAEPQNTVFTGQPAGETKVRPPAAEIVKQVGKEIIKTPPKFFLYAIAGALVVILLIAGSIYSRIHSQNADDGSAPVASSPAESDQGSNVSSSSAPSTGGSATLAAPAEVAAEKPASAPAVIAVSPKGSKRKVAKAPAPVVPVVIPGQLTVNSTPEGAQVLVDGHHDPSWLTPYNMTGLSPGQHIVSVNKPGYAPETRTIEVASGSKSFLVIQLAAAAAALSVSSQPAGAELFIDGKDTGRATPVQMQIDHPGSHTLMLRKQGFLDESTVANLQPGQPLQYSPELRQLGMTGDIRIGGGKLKKLFGGGDTAGMGFVTIRTNPKGAQVAVNKRVLDKTSPVEFYLNPGTYVIDITFSGYKNLQRVVEVEKSGKLNIDEYLQRQ